MRLVLQRVTRASVSVDGTEAGVIGRGLLALVGIGEGDTESELDLMAEKTVNLRIFEDDQHHMNRSLLDVGGAMLAVSQFTLYANCRKGRRPSFIEAARPEIASDLFDRFVAKVRERGVQVETGIFAAMMDVELCNAGPVTIILDSNDLKSPR